MAQGEPAPVGADFFGQPDPGDGGVGGGSGSLVTHHRHRLSERQRFGNYEMLLPLPAEQNPPAETPVELAKRVRLRPAPRAPHAP